MENMTQEQVEKIRKQATEEVSSVLNSLENDYPGITEGLATVLGSGIGALGSLGALYFGGKVVGLSAAGITSGLSAAGALVGGGMAAGIGVLAAPVAILGVGAYAITKKKNAKLAVALGTAIRKLYDVQERLLKNAEFFKEEIASIKATIDLLTKKKPK